MELDEFLERDIIHFLEERKEKKVGGPTADREEDYGLYLTKDYLKEVTRALEKDEITSAQKLFDELRTHYETLPKTSLEAKKIYSILEQSYSKINAYTQLKGNVQSIKTFDDVLDKGFQGSIHQKIHQTTTKIDKKIDNIDEKLTTFGRDVKELKHTIIDSSIPAALVTKGQTIYLKDSNVNILPSDAPKDSKPAKRPVEKKSAPEIERKPVIEITHKVNVPEIFDSKKTSDMNTADLTLLKVPEKNESPHPSLQSPHFKKEEEKKGIHLYKIPKSGKKKKHYSNNSEDIFNMKVKGEQHIMKTKDEKHEPAKIPPQEIIATSSIFKTKPEKMQEKHAEDRPAGNTIPSRITLPSSPGKEPTLEKEKIILKEDDAGQFDSPFQGPKPAIQSKKEPDIPDKKQTTVKSTTNEYEKLYSDALREFSLRNYEGASKLFMKVLEIKPTHRASIIRLKQCEEAMHNA